MGILTNKHTNTELLVYSDVPVRGEHDSLF